MNSELSPMKMGLRSMTRVSSVVSSSWRASYSGTMSGTRNGAATHMTAESPMSARSIAFITLDATRQASCSRSFAR